MAVAQARKKAENTRVRLAWACSARVELATPSVMADTNLPYTACGDGRNSGLTPVSYTHLYRLIDPRIKTS